MARQAAPPPGLPHCVEEVRTALRDASDAPPGLPHCVEEECLLPLHLWGGLGWGEGLAPRFAPASARMGARPCLMGDLDSTQLQSAHCRSSFNPTTPDQGWLPMRPVAGASASPKPSSQASAPSKFS